MSRTMYTRTLRTGGTSDALDGIDGDDLSEGDIATVYLTDGGIEYKYNYRMDATSGASESDPDIIAPDDNPGSKRWILQTTVNP